MFQIAIAHVKVKDWENKKNQLLSLYNNTQENLIRVLIRLMSQRIIIIVKVVSIMIVSIVF